MNLNLTVSDGVFYFLGFGFGLGVCVTVGVESSEVLKSYMIYWSLRLRAYTHAYIFTRSF